MCSGFPRQDTRVERTNATRVDGPRTSRAWTSTGRAVGRIAIGCGVLGLLTGLGPSAGWGGMRYTIDDAVLEPIPTEQRQAVLQARQELEHAEGEERAARSELEEVDRDQDLAAEENQQAELEVEKAVAQQ